RLEVARGSMEYSAVTQPLPVLRRNAGTESSMVAAHKTCVLPTLMSAEPSAVARNPVWISTGRMPAGWRVSRRIFEHEINKENGQQDPGNHDHDARNTGCRNNGSLTFPPFRGLELGHHLDGSRLRCNYNGDECPLLRLRCHRMCWHVMNR